MIVIWNYTASRSGTTQHRTLHDICVTGAHTVTSRLELSYPLRLVAGNLAKMTSMI
ncbi:protein of unknown function [Rhodovastum atsumiense]|nr:protein of unknown function [Rhodovastum atsumiense]